MSLKCLFGHKWEENICELCGKGRVCKDSEDNYHCPLCEKDVLQIAYEASMEEQEAEIQKQYPGQSVMWSPPGGHEYDYIRKNKINCSCGKVLEPYHED